MSYKNLNMVEIDENIPFKEGYRLSSSMDIPQWLLKFKRQGFESYLKSFESLKKNKVFFDFISNSDFKCFSYDVFPSLELMLKYSLIDVEAYTLVLLNGRYVPELSSEEELPFSVFSDGLEFSIYDDEDFLNNKVSLGSDVFSFLNSAFLSKGIVISVGEGEKLLKPIHIISIVTTDDKLCVFMPRIFVNLEKGAEVDLIETSVSLDGEVYFENRVSEISLNENAKLNHYKITDVSKDSKFVHNSYLKTLKSSIYNKVGFYKNLGTYLEKDNFEADENVSICSNISVEGKGKNDIEIGSFVKHNLSNAESKISLNGVANDFSKITFNTDVDINKNIKDVKVNQNSKIILNSNDANAEIKPFQNIYSEDVEAFHGAVVGGIMDDDLFFLESRGFSKDEAKNIILKSHLSNILKYIDNDKIKDEFNKLVWE